MQERGYLRLAIHSFTYLLLHIELLYSVLGAVDIGSIDIQPWLLMERGS